jgi:iduronate 2-sulfatase
MTSRRPDTTQVWNNKARLRTSQHNFTTLPQYFKENGYHTLGFGKIFHNDDIHSWNEPTYHPPNVVHQSDIDADWMTVAGNERTREPLADEHTLQKVKEKLTSAIKTRIIRPFFFAVGFYRPHVPFVCPKQYFMNYQHETGEQYLDDIAWQTPEVSRQSNMHPDNGTRLSDQYLRTLRRAYFACVSYVDSLVGRLLEVLRDLGLSKSTIVVFSSDHGLHLGEHNKWGKVTNLDVSLHVPLMIRIPGLTDNGISSTAIVELVDVFPTLVQATGLPAIPPCPLNSSHVTTCSDGSSLMALTKHPQKEIKGFALSQINAFLPDTVQYSIRTQDVRYTEVFVKPGRTARRLPELYDLSRDPDERNNVAQQSRYSDVLRSIRDKLWRLVNKKTTLMT